MHEGWPIEIIYGAIATIGGVARYLNDYINGRGFRITVFLASAFVSAFGGFMFALLGETMGLPENMLYLMAGLGGFFSDQSVKLAMEYVTKKTIK